MPVHSLDVTFAASEVFGIIALVLVAVFVRVPRVIAAEFDARSVQQVAELVDGEDSSGSSPSSSRSELTLAVT